MRSFLAALFVIAVFAFLKFVLPDLIAGEVRNLAPKGISPSTVPTLLTPKRQLVPVDLSKLRQQKKPLTIRPPGQPVPGQPTQPRPQASPLAVQFVVQPEDTIFPALVLAVANLHTAPEKTPGLLGEGRGPNLPYVAVVAPADHTPITVTISCDAVMERSVFTGMLARQGETYAILPKIRWKYDALARCRQQIPIDVVCRVEVEGRAPVDHVQTCSLRTINDCPLQYLAGGVVWQTDLAFAAYVNEDHPWVQTLLREALESGIVTAFAGYQMQDPEMVLAQVYAVWHTLQARGIQYSSVATLAAPQSAQLMSQHVRFLDECITDKQANCIDGTALFASILRKIGIDTKIALIPGHAFLVFDGAKGGALQYGLETTLLGRASRALGVGFDAASQASFRDAIASGNQKLIEFRGRFGSNRPQDSGCLTIDIAGARLLGVRPIPYVPASGGLQPVRR